jgi:5-methylcytosine-specific restriction endonuclease McrA
MKKTVSITYKERQNRDVSFNDIQLNHTKQLSFINQLLLDQEYVEKKVIMTELKKKRTGYKSQDTKKNIYNETEFICFQDLIELLVCSKLICHYCGHKIFILYENKLDQKQWTLDRIDNNMGHNKDNLVISCLDCNLRRGRLNKDKFLYTKKMNIIKQF